VTCQEVVSTAFFTTINSTLPFLFCHRDATAAAQFQAKISATEHQLERLRAREKELQQEQGARKSHKKLSVF